MVQSPNGSREDVIGSRNAHNQIAAGRTKTLRDACLEIASPPQWNDDAVNQPRRKLVPCRVAEAFAAELSYGYAIAAGRLDSRDARRTTGRRQSLRDHRR